MAAGAKDAIIPSYLVPIRIHDEMRRPGSEDHILGSADTAKNNVSQRQGN